MSTINRKTTESNINISLNIYGSRKISIDTGIGFFDHMLTLLAFWGKWDLVLSCKGDLHVDTHHTIEDTGLALGQAFYSEWRESIGIERISYAFCPLDEALSRVVVDICNRPFFTFDAIFNTEKVGEFDTEMTSHFFRSFSQEARITLHVTSLYGDNAHHIIETMFKGLGLSLFRGLKKIDNDVSSTKGML
ncbi:MAG: imidazoleglycerol-phosphate dehydratase [Candidatus Marinimicrobia bacterium]|nr:imidazoleglycerol-phosphate dehydratase [Candidatus Neomarinimicrobiota bacterium]|tara:strand:- start:36593 stop:37165 length:573 start_codon:yes stop_codon:yes gene_type:complete